MSHKLAQWAHYRHPCKTKGWRFRRYWKWQATRMNFSDGKNTLICYADTPIVRHVKVRGGKSPYDGDWLYWSERLGRDPTKPKRVTRLLKRQKGRCTYCGLRFVAEDTMEVHHQDGNRNNNRYTNLALLHAHCHDQTHSKQCQ
jgi:RNA-directed DNA polymerase